MARHLEIRRHADDDGDDVLTPDGVAAALRLGREVVHGGYALVATSGAQRATQTAACVLAGLGETVEHGVVVVPAFRSRREDEWRAAYREAGSGRLEDLLAVAPDLAAEDGAVLAGALEEVLARLDDGERALVVGHSPTSEAAVHALTGELVEPFGKGEGVVVEAVADGGFAVTRLAAGAG